MNAESESLDRRLLHQELESLRAANRLQEARLLETLAQLDHMLEEVNSARIKAEADERFHRHTSELLSRIEDHLHDILVVTDADGRILRINQRGRAVLGISQEAARGLSLDRLFPPELVAPVLERRRDRRPLTRAALLEAIFRDPDIELELTLGRETADPRPYIVHGSMIYGANGREEGCIVLCSDVSSLKAREAALRQSQLQASFSLIRATIDHIGQGIAVFDRERKLTLWNGQFFTLLELSPELAAVGTDFFAMAACRPRHFGTELPLASGCSFSCDWSNVYADSRQTLHITCRPMPDGGFALTVSDMTEIQLQAETVRKLSHAVEVAPVEIIITNADGTIEYVNPQFSVNTGYSSAEVIGRKPSLLASGMTPPEVYRDLWGTITAGKTWRGELLNRTKSGDLIWEFMAISPVFGENRKITHFLTVKEDITTRKLASERIRKMATHDLLTGLANRALFAEKIQEIIALARESGLMSAMLFIDMDGFKEVNDHHGHAFGDRLLRAMAQRLSRVRADFACIARFGGDEFALVMSPFSDREVGLATARNVVETLGQRFSIDNLDIYVSASVGLVFIPEHGHSADTLLGCADLAMYRAKSKGGNQVCVFDAALKEAADRRLRIIDGLRRAISECQLMVYYQPVVDISSRRACGFEALIRWSHPQWGLVSPAEFIPIAEETGCIIEIGRFVLQEVCRQLRAWQDDGQLLLPVSINLSSLQLTQRQTAQEILDCVAESGLSPKSLRIEITETAAIADFEQSIGTLEELRRAGLQILLDDFGTGYSSLSYLQRLPVDVIKIDRSFIRNIETKEQAHELARSVIQLGGILGKTVVAEGVETEAQFRQLQEWGCDAVQGFLFDQARPAKEAERWLR